MQRPPPRSSLPGSRRRRAACTQRAAVCGLACVRPCKQCEKVQATWEYSYERTALAGAHVGIARLEFSCSSSCRPSSVSASSTASISDVVATCRGGAANLQHTWSACEQQKSSRPGSHPCAARCARSRHSEPDSRHTRICNVMAPSTRRAREHMRAGGARLLE